MLCRSKRTGKRWEPRDHGSIWAAPELTGMTGTFAALRRLRCLSWQIRVVPRESFLPPLSLGGGFFVGICKMEIGRILV